jgi:hypothetical protein
MIAARVEKGHGAGGAMSELRLKLLGGFELATAACVSIPVGARKPAMLLAYLALRPDQPQDRQKLAGLFWGDTSDGQARHSLRQALAVRRQHLRPYDSRQGEPHALAVRPRGRRWQDRAAASPLMAPQHALRSQVRHGPRRHDHLPDHG